MITQTVLTIPVPSQPASPIVAAAPSSSSSSSISSSSLSFNDYNDSRRVKTGVHNYGMDIDASNFRKSQPTFNFAERNESYYSDADEGYNSYAFDNDDKLYPHVPDTLRVSDGNRHSTYGQSKNISRAKISSFRTLPHYPNHTSYQDCPIKFGNNTDRIHQDSHVATVSDFYYKSRLESYETSGCIVSY
jgi:hypothetical protein